MLRRLRYVWPLPATLLGLLFASLARATGGTWQRIDGVLESAGGWPAHVLRRGLPFSGAVEAITFGHVVLAVSAAALAATRVHERAHVRQFERWGVLMLLLYPGAGMLAWAKGGHPYRDNPFERAARAAFAQSLRRRDSSPGSPVSGSIQSEIPSSSSASSRVSPGS